MLVTTPPPGGPLGAIDPDAITDDTLAGVWSEIEQLHAAGISHGNLDACTHPRRRCDGKANVALDDFTSADASGADYWLNRDVAAVLVDTAQLVGNDRAIAAAVKALGKDHVGEVIPFVQPAALPAGAAEGTKHLGKVLKELRADLVTATGVEDSPPLKIKRLTLGEHRHARRDALRAGDRDPEPGGHRLALGQERVRERRLGLGAPRRGALPARPDGVGHRAHGLRQPSTCRSSRPCSTQLACSFLNLITPNGIGGTALQLDYLHKQGVPLASGGSAMVLSTGVGGAIQMVLFLAAAAITATAVDTSSSSSDNTSLWAIVVVAAVDRDRPLRPEDPRQGRARGQEGRPGHLDRDPQPRRRRSSSSAVTSPAT